MATLKGRPLQIAISNALGNRSARASPSGKSYRDAINDEDVYERERREIAARRNRRGTGQHSPAPAP